jgi:hypothetical protein
MKGDMDEPLLLAFYSFVVGFCFGNLNHGMLVCDLRNYFSLILWGVKHFCLKWNNIPLFGNIVQPSFLILFFYASSNNCINTSPMI